MKIKLIKLFLNLISFESIKTNIKSSVYVVLEHSSRILLLQQPFNLDRNSPVLSTLGQTMIINCTMSKLEFTIVLKPRSNFQVLNSLQMQSFAYVYILFSLG